MCYHIIYFELFIKGGKGGKMSIHEFELRILMKAGSD